MEKTYTVDDIGPFLSKKENAVRLITWLMNGAPHSFFSISHACVSSEDGIGLDLADTGVLELWDRAGVEYDEGAVEHACGTVCCIAGAASQMLLGEFDTVDEEWTSGPLVTHNLQWWLIQEYAFEFLGMDDLLADRNYWHDCMWGLFSPDKWIDPPTGPEAAQALVLYSHSGDSFRAIQEVQGVKPE